MINDSENRKQLLKNLKFKKYKPGVCCGMRWDTVLSENGFFRIVVSNTGHFVLYHCSELAPNGITPIGMTEVYRSLELTTCKDYVFTYLGIAKPKTNMVAPLLLAPKWHSSDEVMRLPYKD